MKAQIGTHLDGVDIRSQKHGVPVVLSLLPLNQLPHSGIDPLPLLQPDPLPEATALRPLVSSYRIEIRVAQVHMRGQCTDDLEDVGQLLRPAFRCCITKLARFFKQFVNQRVSIILSLKGSIFRDATRDFDDRRNQITNKFSHAQ